MKDGMASLQISIRREGAIGRQIQAAGMHDAAPAEFRTEGTINTSFNF